MKLSQNMKAVYHNKGHLVNWEEDPIRVIAIKLKVSYGSAYKIKQYHLSLPLNQKIETNDRDWETAFMF